MSKKRENDNFYKEPELKPYESSRISRIPAPIAVYLLKFWFYGASFFLTIMAYNPYIGGYDKILFLALILILVNELMVNTIIIWMHNDARNTLIYLPHFLKRKTFRSFLVTGLFTLVVVMSTYFFIDWMMRLGVPSLGMIMSSDVATLDPITFAFVAIIVDFVWVFTKNQIIKVVKRSKNKKIVEE